MLPILESESVILKPFRIEDARLVQKYAGHKDVYKTTALIPHPYPDGLAEKWIASHLVDFLDKKNVVLSIRSHSGELYGAIELTLRLSNRLAIVGYWIAVPFWNNGYCTSALKLMIKYGFKKWDLNKIVADHLSENEASGRVMQKSGMVIEGVRKQHIFKDNKFYDVVGYRILKSEYNR